MSRKTVWEALAVKAEARSLPNKPRPTDSESPPKEDDDPPFKQSLHNAVRAAMKKLGIRRGSHVEMVKAVRPDLDFEPTKHQARLILVAWYLALKRPP